jgi:sRNA-binding carbon storage regulator CsrA
MSEKIQVRPPGGLALHRKSDEQLVLRYPGGEGVITFQDCRPSGVRVVCDFPQDVEIVRAELIADGGEGWT